MLSSGKISTILNRGTVRLLTPLSSSPAANVITSPVLRVNIVPSCVSGPAFHTGVVSFEAHSRGFGDWDKKIQIPGSSKPHSWPAYNERVYLPDGEYRPAYVCHMRDNIKYSHKKMWPIANFIKGLTIDEAIKQLKWVQKKGAVIAIEVLEEARELAVKEHNVEFRTNLWVAESFATKAQVIKGFRKHARGRFGEIRYQYMHYYVRLEEGSPPKDFYFYKEKFNPKEMLARWEQEHREKTIPYS